MRSTALVALAMLAASCGYPRPARLSDGGAESGASGGSSGAGGSTGAGGASGAGGHGGTTGAGGAAGTGGAGGVAGAGGTPPPICQPTPPGSSTITDFSLTASTGGQLTFASATGFNVGSFGYAAAGESPPIPEPVPHGLSVQATSNGSYVGAGIYFTAPSQPCVDASQFSGITFTIDGSLGTCNMVFSVAFSEDASTGADKRGTCTASACYSPRVPVVGTGVHTVTFASLSAAGNGMPVSTLDLAKVTDLQWELTAPAGTTCTASFTISELAFTSGAGAGDVGGRATGCLASVPAPQSGLIADFAGPQGIEIGGGTYIYSASGTTMPTIDVSGGDLHISASIASAPASQYAGVGVFFSGASCIDASSFTGVEFTVGGTVSGCSLQYSTGCAQAEDVAGADSKAACTTNTCYSPQAPITNVTAVPQTVQVPFYGPPATGGAPLTIIDPTRLTGVQWQLNVPANGGTNCLADLHIDDVRFY
jgi:hypothetical protein